MPEKKHLKITNGCVIQTYEGPTCVAQEFLAGDVDYEDEAGNPVEIDVFKEEYCPFDMVQPSEMSPSIAKLEALTEHIDQMTEQ